MQSEAIYKGATRPAMKFGIPLVPLVISLGSGMLLKMWGGTLWSWWVAVGVLVALVPVLGWMRFVTSKDDQRFRQTRCSSPPSCGCTTATGASGAHAAIHPTCTREHVMTGMSEPAVVWGRTGSNAKRTASQGLGGFDRSRSDIRRPRYWARARTENPLARFVPFSSLIGEYDVITRGGDYLRVWHLAGVPFECADEALIAERHEAMCSLLRNLAGGQWAVWTHRLHRSIGDALRDSAEPGFARDLSRAYYARLIGQGMMSNELYLTLVYRPNVSRVSRALQSTQRSREAIAAAQADALKVMAEKSAVLERVLRGFGLELLGVRMHRNRRYSEVAEFIGVLVNGRWAPVPQSAGALYRTLPATRLFFGGDKLALQDGETRRHAALVDIREYADAVEPGILNALLYEGSEFIETQSFSILPRREAMRALELQRDQLIASDDVVASQVAEMDVALNELGDGQFCMGEYHYSLVVFGDSVADAGRRAAQAIGAVGESSSLQMSPVDLVADAAWFAQMPGNWQWRPRDAKLSSRAFAALASGHNFMRGKRDGNPWGEALALLRTPSGQPFYLNLHSSPEGEDSGDQKLPGNTLIIGSTDHAT